MDNQFFDIDNWSVVSVIGKGAFSTVYLVEHADSDLIESQATDPNRSEKYAMKVIEKQNFTSDPLQKGLKLE